LITTLPRNAIVALILLLSVARAASAAVINVPGDAATIQSGINAASNGDAVRVAPGTYVENINFNGKAIEVIGTGGPQVTTINGGAAGPVVTFSSGEPAQTMLSGFTITGGTNTSRDGFGGGIVIEGASPTILGNVITGNVACNGGGGILAAGSPVIQSNTITNNSQQSGCDGGAGGGGVLIDGSGAPMLISNVISNNSWLSGNGGGVELSAAGAPILMNNLISGNLATGVFDVEDAGVAGGGGIYIEAQGVSTGVVTGNIVAGNTADLGAGVFIDVVSASTAPAVVNNTVANNNSTRSEGSALYTLGFAGPLELFNNLFIGVTSQSAVACDPTFEDNPPVFEYNDAFSPAALGFQGSCTVSAGQYGNIAADPLFANSASGDYHLADSSPAIDVGLNSAAGIPATDYYGNPRIVAGRPEDYPIIDMGAAEFQPASPIPTAVPTAMPTPVGNVINVPDDEESIQGAIDSASNGDVVMVEPGVYFEAINFGGKAIQVVSAGGPQTTIIDAHGLGPVATFTSNETTSSALSGFTITGGLAITEPYATGGGIYIGNSSPTISNDIISQNVSCGGGGGIEIDGGSPIVTGNLVTGNGQFANDLGSCGGGDGGGIRIGSGSALIASNTISNNTWIDGGSGGGVAIDGGSPTLLNNLITNNLATGTLGCLPGVPCLPEPDNVAWGGGVSVIASTPDLIQNLIIDNVADVGGGVYASADNVAGAGIVMINNTLAGNAATRNYGGAMLAYKLDPSSILINNIFEADGDGNAFFCTDGAPALENNDVFSAGGLSYVGDCFAGAGLPGNISEDPLFNAAASNAYTLDAGSPAIDAGLNSAPDLPAMDFYGNPRIVAAHAGCAAVVDVGIAEYQGSAPGPCNTALPKPSKFKVDKALSFGHRVQYTNDTETMKIANPEKDNPATIAFAILGFYATDYGLSSNCPEQLPKGGSCSLNITFTPTTPVKETADLLILDGTDAPIAKVNLSGTTGRKHPK
jgi:hypothetical protein